ncbi:MULTISPECIES: DNA-formamidopyrimidine glycosylase [Aerococcus]|uniref:DNA-formamidopyrimidine glycosylase n=1 Tax=Aerococcus TaxID=1375 RepID=UPI000DCD21F2|nr:MULTISPECIES: DNA-formamidopyrimidine glycosylase [Aerococcus]KAA9299922.1 DNA-formamidopyrimidine glycosylase [Aerococcus tenax]MDK6688041.1 DNA-formamidopyrimidine glycosylase [Aerococcus urinae]MDK8132506.1 DNA-formamidopyrimidine glycosylase [Aerococcus urinae]MDK8484145.1 DNA-formamidopyrimidine glycosylase [Aerococcus urinae]MDL5178193.1 DNA-formamidopyrimidine glycosylase [Aerococcus tenax]
MPELPEVENVRRGLNRVLPQAQIQDVEVKWPKIINCPAQVFRQAMQGETFERVDRYGKYLFFYWSDYAWISHLRMEGKYFVCDRQTPVLKHSHLIIHLRDGRDLRYHDVRKFGRISLFSRQDMPQAIKNLKLGPEPWDISLDQFQKILAASKRPIKSLILDQQKIAGIGNIYADESLFQAGIYPGRPANSLTDQETLLLLEAMRDILSRAVDLGGSSVRTYQNTLGEDGQYQNYLKVYQRQGQACLNCGNTIEKIKLGQRGTHFCPNCQK